MRAKSLLIGLSLTAVRLSHGDDARLVGAQNVGDHDQPAFEQAQSDESLFSILEAIVFERVTRSGEDPLGILEAQTVLGQIGVVLCLIPLALHLLLLPA